MALPLLAIAIPVLHSSGGWIAATATSGYLAGTLSGTWIGAFVLGNAGFLSSLGLVSAAGVFSASGGIAALSSSATLGIGSALTAVTGGVANTLGIAPVVTFLGVTPVGWAVAGASATIIGTLGFYFTRKIMKRLNEEREKGGLPPTTITQIAREVRLLEATSLETILGRLSKELNNVFLSNENKDFSVDGQLFSVSRLKYLINKDGSEELVFVTKMGRKRRVLLVKPAAGPSGQTS